MEPRVMITTQELTKIYDGQAAVNHLTFQVHEGEVFGFLGPNGAGKTTTLLMLLGLTEPTSGTASVAGIDPSRHPIQAKQMIGYLQENMGFYRDLNARQMLGFIAELNNIPAKTAKERIDAALETVGLSSEAAKKIQAYSRGMRQRLGIAEILVKAPKIAFLDEPTLGLDPEASNRLMELILQLSKEQQITLLISSHFLDQVQRTCDRVGIMLKGRMVAQGTMEQLAREKFGVDTEQYTLEEIYMKYFQEG
ncbi:ABC-type multidrug transport system, ATPase component [Candidatus Moduliflexus flocculans]|uniref:ABC-type multidrug transport system, ATPase component n=1 Tax=Candidatus Moduliflexus flocculans TaxID=1499966 RepID=A0A0S6W4I5_9BACT|nr:ABC-type multidrug transport system, ATPase component [Candidatus Moduliflexus flocculans]